MRKSNLFTLFISLTFLFALLTFVDAFLRQQSATGALQQRAKLVGELGLTDLALFTEARYTRHLTQADLHTAFQDHPMGMEHFPSGSLVLPPQGITR